MAPLGAASVEDTQQKDIMASFELFARHQSTALLWATTTLAGSNCCLGGEGVWSDPEWKQIGMPPCRDRPGDEQAGSRFDLALPLGNARARRQRDVC